MQSGSKHSGPCLPATALRCTDRRAGSGVPLVRRRKSRLPRLHQEMGWRFTLKTVRPERSAEGAKSKEVAFRLRSLRERSLSRAKPKGSTRTVNNSTRRLPKKTTGTFIRLHPDKHCSAARRCRRTLAAQSFAIRDELSSDPDQRRCELPRASQPAELQMS
jgi:hypothetical protein